MFIHASVSEFLSLILCVSFIRLISASKLYLAEEKNATSEELVNTDIDDLNEWFKFMECKSIHFNISVVTNSKLYSVEVCSVISDPKFNNCYKYYDITLDKERKLVDHALVKYTYDADGSFCYKFKNVTCGIYGITIHPCYNTHQCARLIIRYPEPINMTSYECFGLAMNNRLIESGKAENKIIVITAIFFILMVLAVIGLISCYCWSGKSKCKRSSIICQNNNDRKTVVTNGNEKLIDKTPTKSIEVYIPHYYDRNGVNKRKIKIIKNFLLASGYYNTVRTIEDELSIILFDVNGWLNRILEKEGENESIRKIILIASEEDDMEFEYELENLIFSELIDKVNDSIEQCCKGYDHLFVVQLDSSMNYSEKLNNIVRRVRFSLTEEMIDDHLINLCLNLCSGSKLNMSTVEADLRKLLSKHPIKY